MNASVVGKRLLGLLFGFGLSCSPARAATCEFDPAVRRFETLLAQQSLSGGALLLGTRQGLLLERYFGDFDVGTRVAIASASKLLSAVRILQLAESGVLDLQAPVADYLPAFTGIKAGMTVEQMFSHTAGYGDDAAAPITLARNISLAEAVDYIACCIPIREGWAPGGQFAYGGVSMHIAGRVAEVVAGVDWQQQWLLHVATPLALTSIDYQALNDGSNYGIGGGARSNLRDYGKVLHMLLNDGWSDGRRLLFPGSVQAMLRDRVGALPVFAVPPSSEGTVRYGLGVWLDPGRVERGEGALAHSLGAFGFLPWIDQERGLFGVFMVEAPAGINTIAWPVYQAMWGDMVAELTGGCAERERFVGIAGDGFESAPIDLAVPP